VKKLLSPILMLCVVASAVAAGSLTAHAQAVTQSRVFDLLAQAKAQVPPAGGQAAGSPSAQGQPGVLGPTGPVQELTMEQAVSKALQLNIDLSVERLNPQVMDAALSSAFGAFVPTLSATLGEQSATTNPNNTYGGGSLVTAKTTTYNVSATQSNRWTGGTFTAAFSNSRVDSDSNNVLLNPSYSGNVRLTFVQPLLKNRSIDSNRQTLVTSEINRRLADISLRAATVNTVANTRNAYWDFVYTVQAIDAAKMSLQLAQKLVEDNKVKVEIGTMAPLDVVSAQAEVATRQQTLVTAEQNRRTAELTLKRLIVNGTDDPIWNASLNPTERPPADVAEKIDLPAALKTALENRTDVVTARKNLEVSDVGLKYYKDQTRAQVDLTAYYQMAGTGGTTLAKNGSAEIPGGYSDALNQIIHRDLPTWSLSVGVSYPLGTSAQDAALAKARVQYQQSLAQLKALELTVATDITNQAMTVQAAFQSVQAAAASRELSQKKLEAEQSKFEVGMSTNYNVVQAQRDFTDAQNSELRAILNYRKALVDFQRKQETASK
jgi:outer membrane protein